ncbi:MAG: glycosyltransferase family 4 protein [Acidimicrobiia bacterium]|nr:glycosyltransferase family 4 protein [Acidimicrobiia bacterium]
MTFDNRSQHRVRRGRLLVISQVYLPDPASVGQHLAGLCEALVEEGHAVMVLTAKRGYDDPGMHYPSRETLDGVRVHRLPWASLGKLTLRRRLLAGVLFVLQSTWIGLTTRRITGVVIATSPPLTAASGWAISLARRVPLIMWVMDLNPEQAVLAGVASPRSLGARLLDWFTRRALARSRQVIALDEAMARLLSKKNVANPAVLPPWAHNGGEPPGAGKAYREQLGIADRFVFMYSGNHSPVHPMAPLIRAVERIRSRDDIRVLFIGGGVGKPQIDAAIARNRLENAISLPYEPFENIGNSLAAADVHVVVMGEHMVGVVHPSKLYGALAAGRPILIVGPHPAAALVVESGAGWVVENEAELIAAAMERIVDSNPEVILGMREAARSLSARFSRSRLVPELVRLVDAALV